MVRYADRYLVTQGRRSAMHLPRPLRIAPLCHLTAPVEHGQLAKKAPRVDSDLLRSKRRLCMMVII
jgi:hypothetical protein